MTKLNYPSNGIYSMTKTHSSSCSQSLSSAISNCNFNIPYDFEHRSWLQNLPGTLKQFKTEIDDIDYKIQKIDANFNSLESDLSSSAKRMTPAKITTRDRMVY